MVEGAILPRNPAAPAAIAAQTDSPLRLACGDPPPRLGEEIPHHRVNRRAERAMPGIPLGRGLRLHGMGIKPVVGGVEIGIGQPFGAPRHGRQHLARLVTLLRSGPADLGQQAFEIDRLLVAD